MEPVICFEMLFPGLSPEEKVSRIADQGFKAVEFWSWRDKDIPALKAACAARGLRVANFSGHRRGSLIAPASHEAFFADLGDAVQAAGRLGCRTLMLLSNELGPEGQVADPYDEIVSGCKYEALRAGLRCAVQAVPPDILLVLEPLNTRIDHPGYFLQDMATAVSLVREVGHPRLKVLCDLYHQGVMGENLPWIVDRYIGSIGYFHVADVPGRHEPGTGSLDWPGLLARIRDRGYTGDVGFEYSPLADSAASLARIRELWDRVLG